MSRETPPEGLSPTSAESDASGESDASAASDGAPEENSVAREDSSSLGAEGPGSTAAGGQELGPVEFGLVPLEERPKGWPAWLKVALVIGGLATVVVVLLFGSSADEAFVYSKLVHEVVAHPDQFRDRELRVEGDLKTGSIRFREDPCEWRFVIQKQGLEMPVSYPQCVVPDTFRDGMGISVTVQGHLQSDGGFLANQVVPRCPSKYEMQQREQNGEAMPHEMAPPTGT